MIRYVLAVVLTVALLAISVPMIEDVAGRNSEQQVQTEIQAIDEAATSLYRLEEAPPKGVTGPQRTVVVKLPRDSLTTNRVSTLVIRREENHSVVSYRIEGRSNRTHHISAPVVGADGEPVELGGTGAQRFVLTLTRDEDGNPIVVIRRI